MRKTIVTYLSPGTFVSEQSCKDIPERNPALAVKMASKIQERYGAKPYGFYFSTLLTAGPVSDGEGGKLDVQPKEIEKSGMYFITGTLRTVDEVRARADEKERILLSNMECNDFPIVVENRNSYLSTHPFNESDVIVDDTGKIIHRGDEPELVEYRKLKIAEHRAEMDRLYPRVKT